MVPAFVGLGAPYWDPDARGAIFGLTLDATAAHLARAALEAVAYQTRDLVQAMVADGSVPSATLRVDGGMAANDGFAIPGRHSRGAVERPANLESTALGAAFHAGLATGVWPDLAAIERTRSDAECFQPRMAADLRRTLVAGWKQALERTFVSSR